MEPLFRGCGTALITPFRNGKVDNEALDNLVEEQIAAGIDALIAAGTTGEPATMTWQEHLDVIGRVVEKVNHRIPVIAGTGSNSTAEAVEAARYADQCGADAQLVVTPYYNKTSQAGLVAHFNAIADAASIPVIVYNVPSRTGINIGPEALLEITRHPKIVAVKEASTDVAQSLEKIRLCGDNVTFYSGNDDLVVPLMSCGYSGVISVVSNVMPAMTTEMVHAALDGNFARAGELQLKLLPLINDLFCETSPIPCKMAMSLLGKCDGELRLPLVPMQENNKQRMIKTMRELGLNV